MKFLIIVGVLVCIGFSILAVNSKSDYDLQKKGVLVKMTIKNLPEKCIGTRINHYATFSYNDIDFIKIIPAGYCNEHNIGDKVIMRYLEGNDHILFPNESVNKEFISSILLGLMGAFVSISQLIKLKKSS